LEEAEDTAISSMNTALPGGTCQQNREKPVNHSKQNQAFEASSSCQKNIDGQ